jgi:hypothetical protein
MLSHTALLKALNNIPWTSDNDEYISIKIYQSTPSVIYMKSSTSAYRKISTGSMVFRLDPHLHGQHANTGAYNLFEKWYIRSEICTCAHCIKSLLIIMKVQHLGYSEMYIISVSNTNYNSMTPISQDGII